MYQTSRTNRKNEKSRDPETQEPRDLKAQKQGAPSLPKNRKTPVLTRLLDLPSVGTRRLVAKLVPSFHLCQLVAILISFLESFRRFYPSCSLLLVLPFVMSKFGDSEAEEDSLDESLSEKSDGDEDEDDDEGEDEDEGRPDDANDIINDEEEESGGDEEESHHGHHHRKRPRKGTA